MRALFPLDSKYQKMNASLVRQGAMRVVDEPLSSSPF